MPRYIARVTMLVEASSEESAHENITEMLNRTQDWSYVSIDGDIVQPMVIPEPSLDELFDSVVSDQ